MFKLFKKKKPKVAKVSNLPLIKSPPAAQPSLTDLPPEIIKTISSLAPSSQNTLFKAKLMRTCRTLHHLFKQDLEIANLLHHVVLGRKNKVEEILKAFPELLYKKALIQNLAGHTIEGTAYRVALGARDISLGKHEEMVEMIERMLVQLLPDGEEELVKQLMEQFPEDFEAQQKIRSLHDSNALKKVFDAIDQSNSDVDCEQAIIEFKSYLKQQTQNIIRTGFHFNVLLYVEAINLYDRNYGRFGYSEGRKNRLVVLKVLCSIERYFPAYLLHLIYNYFEDTIKQKRPIDRTQLPLSDKPPFYLKMSSGSHFIVMRCGNGIAMNPVSDNLASLFNELNRKHEQSIQQKRSAAYQQKQNPSIKI